MKGRLADTVETNASKMAPKISGSTFSKETEGQRLSPWQWGTTDAGLGALAANVRPDKHQPRGRR